MGSHLENKLRQLGLSADGGQSAVRIGQISRAHSFRLYFPCVRISDGYHFTAAPAGDGYNFTGKVLGMKGQNAADIAGKTGARIEVCDMDGNLTGRRPDSLDPNLHVLVTSDSMIKIQKAVKILCEQLAPKGGPSFKPFNMVSGSSAKLELAGPPPQSQAAFSEPGRAQPFGSKLQLSQAAAEAPTGAALKSQQRRSMKVFTGARAAPVAADAMPPVSQPAAPGSPLSPWNNMAAAKSEVDAIIKASKQGHAVHAEQYHGTADVNNWEPTTPHTVHHYAMAGSESSSDGSAGPDRGMFANMEGFGTATPQPQAAPSVPRKQDANLLARLQAAAAHDTTGPSDTVEDMWPVAAESSTSSAHQEVWPTMIPNIPIPIPVPVPVSAPALMPYAVAAPGPAGGAPTQQGSMESHESADLSELLALLDVQQ